MNKNVTVYSTISCPYCRLEKQWFDKRGIKYSNIFVDENDDAADEMIKKSGQMGVPVTEISDAKGKHHIVVGFDRPKLAKLLGIDE
jgi:glutaredoxin 3